MKKMLSGLLMLAMFLSLSLAGWSAPALAETPADRAGSYVIEELYMDGEDYTEAMKTQGFTVTLVLNEDGTARMESSNTDETLTFRWDEAYFIYDSGEKTPYEYQDGVIRMEEDGSIMVFRKLSGDAEVAGEPEEPADITGTWVGTLDMREMLVESAADLAPYLKMAPVFVTLEMEGDGSYTLQVDASPAMDAMKDALRDYLKAFCAENNLTEEQFAASTGMTVDEAVESSMKDVDMSGAMQSGSGRYLEKDGAVVWDPGANAIHGLFTGDYLSFSVEPFGDVLLSRQKLDGVWMARVDMRDILVEETPELEDYLGSANMNVYLVLKDDGSYELIADGSSLIPAFREAAYKYLETMCEENGKSIDDLQELADFLDDRIGFVADTSILCGQGEKIEDYLNAFGNRIRHIHLTDGKDGSLHIIPGEGTVPLKEIVETCPAGTDRIAEGWFHTLEINAVPCLSEPETSIQKTYHWLQAIDAR